MNIESDSFSSFVQILRPMELTNLTAVSPIDGRYQSKTSELGPFFSEYALFKYRVQVEVNYFIALVELPIPQLADFPKDQFQNLHAIYKEFSLSDAERIKEIERTINHDVKAVEYLIKEKMDALGLGDFKEFVHFGLTSQDINNTSVPLSIKDALDATYYGPVNDLLGNLEKLVADWKEIPMLARTHGQPASPTRLGKEMKVFVDRIEKTINLIEGCYYLRKIRWSNR